MNQEHQPQAESEAMSQAEEPAFFDRALLLQPPSITTRHYQRSPCNWARSRLRWEQ